MASALALRPRVCHEAIHLPLIKPCTGRAWQLPGAGISNQMFVVDDRCGRGAAPALQMDAQRSGMVTRAKGKIVPGSLPAVSPWTADAGPAFPPSARAAAAGTSWSR